MAQPDDLSKKMEEAVRLIEQGEFMENQGNFELAIKNYQEGAHLLSQASFAHEQIEQIYARIGELKDLIIKQKMEAVKNNEQQLEDAEAEAFDLIDMAEIAISDGEYDKAIQLYSEAIPRLQQVGYSTQHVSEKIADLRKKVAQMTAQRPRRGVMKPGAKPVKPVKGSKPVKPAGAVKPPRSVTPTPVPVKTPVKEPKPLEPISTTSKIKQMDDFKEKREKIEEIEEKAFALIDEAKVFTEQEKYNDALTTYALIKNMLRNAGWLDEQIEPVLIQERLVQEIMEEQASSPAASAPAVDAVGVEGVEGVEGVVPKIVKQKLDMVLDQDSRMRKLRAMKMNRQNAEAEAFKLMTEAQKLYKDKDIGKDYLGAIELYKEAIKLLHQEGWIDQVEYIEQEIEHIRNLHVRHIQLEKAKIDRERLEQEEMEARQVKDAQIKEAIEGNIVSISSILDDIGVKKKEQAQKEKEESIKQKLMEEKRFKSIVARKTGGKSLDSLKELLFGDHDAKRKKEEQLIKEKQEQEFISKTSKKFFDLKKELREQKKSQVGSVEKMVDIVHEVAVKHGGKQDVPRKRAIDLHARQEQEVKKEAEQKIEAVSDVLSMLSSIKKKDDNAPKSGDKGKEKESGIKDEELKNMFANLKKKEKE
ncbi:MAG: hypothetical protein ACTSUE_04265 [Promethearchaeota archaeon]